MFRDDAWWMEHDRALERGDAAVCCGRHVDDCRCGTVTRLPRLRVARPMPDQAGALLAFPSYKSASPGWLPDEAA